MPAFLVPVDPGQCLIPLEKAIVLIGRQSDCDVSLTHSRKISRKHCCIAQVDNHFVVRDLGSTNGIFVNGNRIEKESAISIGDELIIGDVRFRMQNEAIASKSKTKRVVKDGPVAVKTVEESSVPPAGPPPLPVRSRQLVAPPSLDIPVALAEENVDFDMKPNRVQRPAAARRARIDDVVPLDEFEEEIEINDAVPLGSDSFLSS